jgi:ABC-type glutathione transport system ATPase component
MTCCEFVLEVRGLSKTYIQGRWWQRKFYTHALDNVSLALRRGTTLAIVGASACGKTTLAMCMVGLEQPEAGEILLHGRPQLRRRSSPSKIQLVFQDSAGALNPRMSALEVVEEPLLISKRFSRDQRVAKATETMERVGISPDWKDRKPHEFSGGQRQRLTIARALVVEPMVLILDEAFVGLDLSIQGQIANLLLEVQESNGLSYICISHDLAFVRKFADTVAVMERGRIVETTTPEHLIQSARTPLTAHLKRSMQQEPSVLGAAAGAYQ